MSLHDEHLPEEEAVGGTEPGGTAASPEENAAPAGAPANGAGAPEHGSALAEEASHLESVARERDEYLLALQRTQADFENYRKRVAKEAAGAQQRGVAKLARELLPALDNLDRAIEAAAEEDPLLQGVKLVRNELHAALTRAGIESFSPEGERFDPAQHEAMAQQPVDGAQSGCVAEVYQAGYRMGETVIRPARVLVAA